MNAPRPHDLLWGMPVSGLPADAPRWAQDVLLSGQPVVVRRATCANGWVAVGLRGQGRAQRSGVLMRLADIRCQQGPEALRWQAEPLACIAGPGLGRPGTGCQRPGLGPTGGVGYQIATGMEVVHADSDLDLLLRTPQPLARAQARELLDILDCAPCRIDLQLETPAGAVALREWAGFARRVLLKSAHGPRLVSDPWAAMERAA